MESFRSFRSLLWLLVRRELRARYAGSFLGSLWNVIHPIFMISIYVLVFSSVMRKAGGGMTRGAYVTHLCAGLIPWLVFSETLQRCTGILQENANFLKRLNFPHEALHTAALVHSLLVHSVSALALILLLIAFGVEIGPRVLLIFPALLGIGITALGLGMALSALHLLLRDVGQFVAIALQSLFWLTPIVYVPASLPGFESIENPGWVYSMLSWNPLLGYVAGAQSAFGSPQAYFQPGWLVVMILLPPACVWLGRATLRRRRAEILDLL